MGIVRSTFSKLSPNATDNEHGNPVHSLSKSSRRVLTLENGPDGYVSKMEISRHSLLAALAMAATDVTD